LHGWFGTFDGVAVIAAAALPLAVLIAWALARRRRAAGSTPALAWRTSLADVGIVYGTVPTVWLSMVPGNWLGIMPIPMRPVPMRPIPLWDLFAVLSAAPLTAVVQILGNLLVFAALGFLAPLRFPALASIPRILALTAGCSIVVETARYVLQLEQFIEQLGQLSAVDEVLLNAAGAGLAALASRHWWRADATNGQPTSTSA
jgi:hypothetical protein